MNESLDNIMDNIYKSEQESNAQQEYLQELKHKITAAEKKVKEVEKQRCSMQVDIEKKIKRLANREVALLSLNVREKCLQESIKELKSENENLLKTREELKTRLKCSREKLCKQSYELMEERNLLNQKLRTSFVRQVFPETNKAVVETKQDTFINGSNTSVTNFTAQREETNVENDNLWLWDVDFNTKEDD